MTEHLVMIPPEGLMHLFHATKPLDFESTLRANGADGVYLNLVVMKDHLPVGRVSWCNSSITPVNPRAREALVHLSDVHLIFTGPVIFSELTENAAEGIIFELSTRGG